jgi:penicillin-binding protein 1A
MGIKSKLDPTPALALGSSDVNLLELVNAYCTPVNKGRMHDPVLVTRIVDRDGDVIYEAKPDDKEALDERSAFLTQQLLMGGMSGTSSRLMGYVGRYANDTDFGGKTGTSNNHSDAWFIGTTPKLVCGAWVGGEYRCIHFRTGELGQGNRTALPICGYFLQSVLDDPQFKQYHSKFVIPEDANLTSDMYGCGGYFRTSSDSDSLATDSLGTVVDTEAVVDELGNVVNQPQEPENAKQKPVTEQPQAAEEPKEQ